MATIQIRGIPEVAYEVIRRRARAENRSIQSYMLELVLECTSRPTKAEVLAAWDRRQSERERPFHVPSDEIAGTLREGRHERDRALAPLDGE